MPATLVVANTTVQIWKTLHYCCAKCRPVFYDERQDFRAHKYAPTARLHDPDFSLSLYCSLAYRPIVD